MHPGYIDLILVTSGLSRRRCPPHILHGGDFTADLPHNHHHPPLCSLGNPLIPTVISFVFVVARLSLARTPSHQSSFVLCGFGKRGGEREAYWSKECATCYQDACQERGWTLLRVLIGLIFLASSMQGLKGSVRKKKKKKRHQSVEVDVTQLISNPDGFKRNLVAIKSSELNPTDYQIKQLYNADEC